MNKLSNPARKLIAIVGPTALGKSSLAVQLARKFHGEVISADSRQVYRGMDIGTGKITKKEMRGVPHHLLGVASPLRHGSFDKAQDRSGQANFTVVHYQKLARRAIQDILRRGKLPILCGGTGLYIDAALYDYALPAVPPNWRLRRTLEKKTADALFAKLKRLDPVRAGNIDRNNKRRLVRALEIIRATGVAVPSREETLRRTSPYDFLKIGINPPQEILKQRIKARLDARFKVGMIAEVKRLHARGVSWQRLDDFGLEYRYISRFLRGLLTKEQMLDELSRAIYRYAKRQMTWFKGDRDTQWVKNKQEAFRVTAAFLA